MKDRWLYVVAYLIFSLFALAVVSVTAYATFWDFPQRIDPVARMHYSTGAFITPTPYPISYLPAPEPAGQYDLIDPKGYSREFWVCEIEAEVHGAPGDGFPVLYVLRYGDEVRIGELSNGYGDWFAEVGRAEWISMDTLCRHQAQ